MSAFDTEVLNGTRNANLRCLEHEVRGTHAHEETVQCLMEQNDAQDELEILVDGVTAEQISKHETKAAKRAKIMKGTKNGKNEVWCDLVLVLDNITLMCLRIDCFNHRTRF